MVSRFNKSRRGVVAGVVALAPLVLANSCSEPTSSFFDPPMSGGTGGASGGSSGTPSAGGTSAGKGGTAATGGSASGGSTSGGADASGGTSGNGSGGDAPNAGTAGKDSGTGGVAGMDALGGEGGMGNEGGMTGGTSGTAGSGGTAGTAGTGGDGGTSGNAGSGGTAGTAGAGGNAGNAGNGGNNTAGAGGAGCTPRTESCDGKDNDCGNDVDEGGVCPDGCHGATFEGQTYLLCTAEDELEWVEAREFCMDADSGAGNIEVAGPMTLVEINSPEENAFLVDWIESDGIEDDVWMGATDSRVEGQWVWDRGDATAVLFYTVTVAGIRGPVNGAFHDFPTGQPTYNGVDCGIFDASDDFEWDDGACTQGPLNTFICGEIP
jgi:hypothetical protein